MADALQFGRQPCLHQLFRPQQLLPEFAQFGAAAAGGAAPGSDRTSGRRLLDLARGVVRVEAAAIAALEEKLGDEFLAAVERLAGCRGKVIVSGVGKSGLIAHKLAATLTSTGTPAVFLHPADALHGDAGLFTPGDAALFVSKSGASDELLALMRRDKNASGGLTLVLPGAAGPGLVEDPADHALRDAFASVGVGGKD